MSVSSTHLAACRTCGLVQHLPPQRPDARLHCVRCDTPFADPGRPSWTAPLAVAALLLFPLAVSLPVISMARFGSVSSTDVWHGAWDLMENGHLLIGLVVLICSVAVPVVKLIGLVVLSLAPRSWRNRHRALTWRLIESLGRWGMVDVMLVAGVVAAVKLGDVVTVTTGPGAVIFATMVLLSLLASATFDPAMMWKDDDGR